MSTSKRFLTVWLAVFICGFCSFGCTASPRFSARDQPKPVEAQPAKQSDEPAEVARADIPVGKILLTLEGVASYYGDDFHGRLTSNGEMFDMNDLTAAHRTFPFGTKIKVTSLMNKLSVIVRVNDRGPFKEGRIIDLSLSAAKAINLIPTGTARVKLEVLEWGDGK